MQKEPTINIKALLKTIGGIEAVLFDKSISPLNTWSVFADLKNEVKKLRKENKRLKKENEELKYTIDTVEFLKDVLPPEKLEKIRIITSDQIRQTVIELPIAEFKCAKTNKPSMEGRFGVLYSFGGILKFNSLLWENGQWKNNDYEVLAFTETLPEQILKALK